MTNYEHYKDQISRITRLGVSFAKIKGGELGLCQNIECEDCEWRVSAIQGILPNTNMDLFGHGIMVQHHFQRKVTIIAPVGNMQN